MLSHLTMMMPHLFLLLLIHLLLMMSPSFVLPWLPLLYLISFLMANSLPSLPLHVQSTLCPPFTTIQPNYPKSLLLILPMLVNTSNPLTISHFQKSLSVANSSTSNMSLLLPLMSSFAPLTIFLPHWTSLPLWIGHLQGNCLSNGSGTFNKSTWKLSFAIVSL